MNLAVLKSRANVGLKAPLVTVEIHLSSGLPGMSIVGLPETAVKESKDRVRSALLNTHFEFPARKIIVNLAPADLPKEGSRFDLPIALGILAASGQIPRTALEPYEFAGELALTGHLRPIDGILPFAAATQHGNHRLICAFDNVPEAKLIQSLTVYGAHHLLEVCDHLTGRKPLAEGISVERSCAVEIAGDLSDIKGQYQAKRGLEIAAAGGHSLLLIGPPGTGKTMLANRFSTLLPPMTEEEALASAMIHSISKTRFHLHNWGKRPFRAPHHTISSAALVGGGNPPKPGEISKAHHGVLFLDELPEFHRNVLEALREPLESGHVYIARANQQVDFPANFQLIATMNPCPCGHAGDPQKMCRCSAEHIMRYRNRLSGPLLDRIDMHLEVAAIPKKELQHRPINPEIVSPKLREKMIKTRDKQFQRIPKLNAAYTVKDIEQFCFLNASDHDLLLSAMTKLGLSMRAYHRLLKIARTIADLEEQETIQTIHITEALSYRSLDRLLK